MKLRAAKLESNETAVADPGESANITSRARSRIAALRQKPFDVRSISLTGLFILALFYTMYFMRSILLPIVLALLLSYLLRPIVRALGRAKIPTPLGAALILIALFISIGYGMSTLAAPVAGWRLRCSSGNQPDGAAIDPAASAAPAVTSSRCWTSASPSAPKPTALRRRA